MISRQQMASHVTLSQAYILVASLLLVALVVISGCAALEEGPPPAAVAVTTPVPEAPVPPPAPPVAEKPEFGSIWTEGSSWNHLYSLPPRNPGDTIQVKVGEKLRNRILSQYNFLSEPATPSHINAMDTATPPQQKPEVETPKILKARIRELKPKGAYEISVADKVDYGKKAPRVFLEGRVSESDIDNFDTVSSDAIQDLKVEVYSPDTKNTTTPPQPVAMKEKTE